MTTQYGWRGRHRPFYTASVSGWNGVYRLVGALASALAAPFRRVVASASVSVPDEVSGDEVMEFDPVGSYATTYHQHRPPACVEKVRAGDQPDERLVRLVFGREDTNDPGSGSDQPDEMASVFEETDTYQPGDYRLFVLVFVQEESF